MKMRIAKELDKATGTTFGDDEVRAVLLKFGTPANLARDILGGGQLSTRLMLSTGDRRWLGVCGGVGEHFGLNVKLVRFIAFCLGLMTGPVMLIVYLAVYFEMYLTADSEDIPRIDKLKLVKLVLGALAAASAFYAATRGVLALMTYAYMRFMEKSEPFLGKWGWLEANATWLFLGVLCVLMPIALLSGLPLATGWDHTGKRVVQAGLALYALVLCLGIASALAGVIFLVVEEFT